MKQYMFKDTSNLAVINKLVKEINEDTSDNPDLGEEVTLSDLENKITFLENNIKKLNEIVSLLYEAITGEKRPEPTGQENIDGAKKTITKILDNVSGKDSSPIETTKKVVQEAGLYSHFEL